MKAAVRAAALLTDKRWADIDPNEDFEEAWVALVAEAIRAAEVDLLERAAEVAGSAHVGVTCAINVGEYVAQTAAARIRALWKD